MQTSPQHSMSPDLAARRELLARFDRQTVAVLARLDAEVAHLDALAERLGRDDDASESAS